MKLETDIETIARMIACHNAFHSPDGREIKTEKITEGLVWEMMAMLKVLAASPPTFEVGEDAAALLAKLEPEK